MTRFPAAPTAEGIREALGDIVDREGGAPAGWESRMADFLGLLIRRNAAVNLISRRTAAEVVDRQVLPSLAVLKLIPPEEPLRLLDIGTGGGFPGIPVRILRPQVRIDLVEATRNKCRFLEECLAQQGWEEARVHWCRVEAPTEDLTARAPFDLAVARAVGDDERIARSATPLLRSGGGCWAFAPPAEGDPFHDAAGTPVTALRRID